MEAFTHNLLWLNNGQNHENCECWSLEIIHWSMTFIDSLQKKTSGKQDFKSENLPLAK